MFTKAFWKGAAERGVKTFAQSLLGSLIITTPIVEQQWPVSLGVAATATLLSLLTALGSPKFVAGSSPDNQSTSASSTVEDAFARGDILFNSPEAYKRFLNERHGK